MNNMLFAQFLVYFCTFSTLVNMHPDLCTFYARHTFIENLSSPILFNKMNSFD